MKRSPADAEAERQAWTIDALVPGGDGMGHLSDGRVGFAHGAFPGDRIRATTLEAGKGFVRATRFEVEGGGAARVKSPCPVADACGGCEWMGLAREAQVEWKGKLVRAALERTGKLRDLPETIPVVTSGADLAYRSRVRYHVENGKVGFHARGSHTLVEVPACLVCRPELNEALEAVRELDSETLSAFRELEIRVANVPAGQATVSIRFFPLARGGPPKLARTALERLSARHRISVEGDPDGPDADESFALPGGVELRAAPGVFTQVNWPVNNKLVQAVVDGARARSVTAFCDAFAGAGNFTLPLLAFGASGVAVEKDRRAVASARRAARDAGRDPGVFVSADAGVHLKELARRGERFDLVLLDPPRRGAREVLSNIVALEPRYVALCSCDPVTLARDAAQLADSGYLVEEVTAFDMFPHTHHVEVLLWMIRRRFSAPPSAAPPA